jgi:lipopolysaccharide assembly protein A
MLRALLLAPFLLLLIAFALSNPQPVSLSLWPTDVTLEAPLSIAILVIAAVFFLLGGLITWLPALGHRRRAHVAEKRAKSLESALAARDKPAVVPVGNRLTGPPVINAARVR